MQNEHDAHYAFSDEHQASDKFKNALELIQSVSRAKHLCSYE